MRIGLVACAGALACAIACGRGASTSSSDQAATGRGGDAPIVNTPATPHVKMISPDLRALPAPKIDLPMIESIRMLDPGAAPRAPLRYRWDPKANREVTALASLKSRRLENGAWSDALVVAPVREGFGLITEPVAGGGARLSFRGAISEVTGTPDAASKARAEEYLSAFRALIQNRRGTASVDDRGRLTAPVFADAAPDASDRDRAIDEVQQRWIAAAVILPEEPIGKGARWRVVTVLRVGAAVVKQTAEYTLVEARAGRWVIDEDVRRIGEDQLVDAPGLPAGAIAELIALFRENQGRVELSPSLPWPIAGKVTTELRVHARVGIPGEPVHEDITEDLGTMTFSWK